MATTEQSGERAHRIYYEVGQLHFQEQRSRLGIIETKAHWVLGFGAVLLAIMGIITPEAPSWTKWLAIAAGGAFLLSAYTVYRVMQVTGWDLSPNLSNLKSYLNDYTEEQMREWSGDELTRSVATNNKTLNAKAGWLGWAIHCFALEATVVAAIAISIAHAT